MRMRWARLVAVVASAGAVVLSTSCLDPTQVTLDVSTDVACEHTKDTTFTGGKPRTTENAAPTTVTSDCAAGRVGTLVATPGGSKDSEAAFRVVLGVDRPATECTAANGYKGCIVQRRELPYVLHRPVKLPIRMWLACIDVACDERSTCARTGQCVPARIDDPGACAEQGCYPTGDDDPTSPSPTDGGGGGGADVDAPFVVPPPPKEGRLYCPPATAGCDLATTCCWSRNASGGRCAASCNVPSEIPMRCNRKADCTNGGACCATVGTIATMAGPDAAIEMDGGIIVDDGGPVVDGGSGGDGGATRIIESTSCAPVPSSCAAWICLTAADCPAPLTICDMTTPLFAPTGIFGECR